MLNNLYEKFERFEESLTDTEKAMFYQALGGIVAVIVMCFLWVE